MTVFRGYVPGLPLAAFVEKFWLYEGIAMHTKERRLPDGSMELVINLRKDMVRVYDRQHVEQFQCVAVISTRHTLFTTFVPFLASIPQPISHGVVSISTMSL